MGWKRKKIQRNIATKTPPIPLIPQGYAVGAYSSGSTGPTFVQAMGGSFTEIPVPDPFEVKDKGLAIEPIVALRSYYFDMDSMSLASYNWTPWPHREPLRAYCGANLFTSHDVPSEDCNCGVYAWHLDRPEMVSGNLYGEVYLWGDVLICPQGYRAECAYPKSLTIKVEAETRIVRSVRDALDEAYGVPVTVVIEPTTHAGQPF